MNGAASGLLMLVRAGVVNRSFTLAMKYARRQARENTHLARTVLSDIVIAVRPGAAAQCGVKTLSYLVCGFTFRIVRRLREKPRMRTASWRKCCTAVRYFTF